MNHRRLALAAVPAILLGLAACSSTPSDQTAEPDTTAPPPPAQQTAQPGKCKPDAAGGLVGKPKQSDAQAKRLTGATVVRQLGPNDAATMDLNPDRITIVTDPATNRVTQASCG